jgi:hypothetical protein
MLEAIFCELARAGVDLSNSRDTLAMEDPAISRILVGPYGLHAFGLVLLSFFIVFLWVFNFTNFS